MTECNSEERTRLEEIAHIANILKLAIVITMDKSMSACGRKDRIEFLSRSQAYSELYQWLTTGHPVGEILTQVDNELQNKNRGE